MWQAEALQRSLDGIDGHGIRPVLRLSPPAAAAPIEMAREERRQRPRRHSPPASGPVYLKELASAAARAALDRIDLAIVLLHPDRRVLLSNSAAHRAQARGDCFHIRAQKLQLADRPCQKALEEFLAKGTTKPSSPNGPICVASRDEGSSCYFLFAEWLEFPAACDGIASLQIHEPRLAGQLDPEMLGALYGLTRMESALVVALYSAPILQIAADHCGIALNTAKTHLKHVFAKCGVHSKAELLRLLALGPRIPG
jgi:DNA-binding CsgD family transcriptional regulator